MIVIISRITIPIIIIRINIYDILMISLCDNIFSFCGNGLWLCGGGTMMFSP